jgi:hypothetical protein
MNTYSVLVENLSTGRRSVAEWTLDSYREELTINGEKVPIGLYWAVVALDKAGMLLPAVLAFVSLPQRRRQ